MPLSDVELELMELLHDAFPASLNKKNIDIAKKEYAEYKLNKNFKSVEELNPYTIHLIISDLEGEEQRKFIKENIATIQKKDEDIFIYKMMAPRSLSYYLNYNSLKEICALDKRIFSKLLNGNVENIIEGFTNLEIFSFFNEFNNEMKENMEEHMFVNFYICAKQKIYHNIISKVEYSSSYWRSESNRAIEESSKLTKILLEKYSDFINKFNDESFLSFCSTIVYLDESDQFLVNNKSRLEYIYKTINADKLFDSFENIPVSMHGKIFEYFGDVILKRGDLANYFVVINSDILCDYYLNYKEYFKNIGVEDWLKIPYLDDNLRVVLDDYNRVDFEKLYTSDRWCNDAGVAYLENKYRNSISDENIIDINNIKTIYSNEYLKNLEIIKRKLYRKEITKNSDLYKEHFNLFINFLLKNKVIENISIDNIKEIERYFFQVVKGVSLNVVKKLNNLNKIALYNRVGLNYSLDESEFNLEQIQSFNVKEHKLLIKDCFSENDKNYNTLSLKLMLLVGYEKAKYILSLDNNINTLEHLVGNVDVKGVKINELGESILNQKIINLLFNDLNRNRVKLMVEDKTSELYKYFPRIFNEWDLIEFNKKNTSLKAIIEFLKSDEVSLSANYYRLKGLFKYIGCNKDIVKETLTLHDEMIKRVSSTIPRVKGNYGEYCYEVLKFNDMEGLTVGNKTDCCFTVKGNAYSSLKHALTNKNGRILVIKRNDEIVAHSWLWRNGNVLCLDNIEVSKSINEVDFLDVYLKFADEVIEKSSRFELEETRIKNITIGRTYYDKKIKGIEHYKRYVLKSNGEISDHIVKLDALPSVEGDALYSDAKSKQILIKGNGDFKYYDNEPYYGDTREDILFLLNEKEDNREHIYNIINGLRYLKYKEDDRLNELELINIDDYKNVFCNNDWYILIDKQGNIEKYCLDYDNRAQLEMERIYKEEIEKMKKNKNR